jgi:hypothetical protein
MVWFALGLAMEDKRNRRALPEKVARRGDR